MKTELEVLNMVVRKCFPLKENQAIDLFEFKKSFDKKQLFDGKISYNPEMVNNSATIEFEDLKFWLFDKGCVVVFGLKSTNGIDSKLNNFWDNFLKNFIKSKEEDNMKFKLRKKIEDKQIKQIWGAFLKDLENIEKNVLIKQEFKAIDLNILKGHIGVFKNTVKNLGTEFKSDDKEQQKKQINAFNEIVETTQLLHDKLKEEIIDEETKKCINWLKQTYQECINLFEKK